MERSLPGYGSEFCCKTTLGMKNNFYLNVKVHIETACVCILPCPPFPPSRLILFTAIHICYTDDLWTHWCVKCLSGSCCTTICDRCFNVYSDLIDLYQVPSTDAATLVAAAKEWLKDAALPISKLYLQQQICFSSKGTGWGCQNDKKNISPRIALNTNLNIFIWDAAPLKDSVSEIIYTASSHVLSVTS